MKISFLGAAGTVTGSCLLLEHNNTRFLLDCGMFQGNKKLKENNYADFPFNPADISFVLLSHAHIDHSGLLPKLVRLGFRGPIYTTSASADLASVMLPDSAHIQETEVERKNRKGARSGQPAITPIYQMQDAYDTVQLLHSREYGRTFSPAPGISVTFYDAGHILGSAMLMLEYIEGGTAKKLLFTGDIGRYDAAIVNNPTTIPQADYIIMETTYGNRLHHDDGVSPEQKQQFLAATINDTFNRGGNVIIPAFAVDRCQDLLLELNVLLEEGLVKNCKIYVDSPLAVKATAIFNDHPEYFDQETLAIIQKYGRSPFENSNIVFSQSVEESQQINQIPSRAIIISASGMADAGRIKHHLKHNLWRPESTVIFAGYQAEGTLGRRLIEGEKLVRIHGEEIEVKARIIALRGYSAHADYNELCRWLDGFTSTPTRIFLTHGEEAARENFAAILRQRYGIVAELPRQGETFDLSRPTLRPTLDIPQPDTSAIEPSLLFLDINDALSRLVRRGDTASLQQIHDYVRRLTGQDN
ncbi:MAG: MBL fold metallo-hydrolase [Firmicutes bacterium]|nr:MBL fold metallo-hydrolase [Bacillota bacterium]